METNTRNACQSCPPNINELLRTGCICKRFSQSRVLSNVSFSVNAGEILGIIGPNGAGKTTLLECLTGLLPLTGGEIYWQQQPVSPLHTRRFMFYQPDGILPYGEQRVAQVATFFQQLFGAEKELYLYLLERLGLNQMLDRQVYSLSKGYRRRLLLLIGLLSPQPLLMLDEPFDGFDLRQTLGVMELLRETLAGRSLLLSIHQLSEAEKICDRFLLLNEGRVAALGSLAQLRDQAGISEGGLEEVFLALV
ncbi:MAG: ABC transporter ATP-binding protein [Desulfocapsa sp.]|nr:MAG: ABC transporter ATP-binding protein [Desulfocapsa sp.]